MPKIDEDTRNKRREECLHIQAQAANYLRDIESLAKQLTKAKRGLTALVDATVVLGQDLAVLENDDQATYRLSALQGRLSELKRILPPALDAVAIPIRKL